MCKGGADEVGGGIDVTPSFILPYHHTTPGVRAWKAEPELPSERTGARPWNGGPLSGTDEAVFPDASPEPNPEPTHRNRNNDRRIIRKEAIKPP